MFWSMRAAAVAFLVHVTCSVITGVTGKSLDVCASCHVNATCEEKSDGHRVCNCMYGFVGNGRTYCQDKDECQIGANKICGDHTACHNTYGSFYCTCLSGYSPSNHMVAFIPNDGTFCDDVNECQAQGVCGEGAQCVNFPGSFNCHCREGYRLLNGSEPFKPGLDGSHCEAIECGQPPSVAHAHLVSYTGTRYLSQAIFDCSEGFFQKTGDTSAVCGAKGVWNGPSLVCEEIDCGEPPSFPNTVMLWNQSRRMGAEVHYQCIVGFSNAANGNVSQCTNRGRWSSVSVLCREIRCGAPPALPFAHRKWNGSSSLGSRVEYYCNEGSLPVSGQNISVCTRRGLWTNVTLQCEALCGPAPLLPHAVVLWQNGTVALHRCQDGFRSWRGSSVSLCGPSQAWRAATLRCRQIESAIRDLEVFNERCLRWKAEPFGRDKEHYIIQFVGTRAYQRMFRDEGKRIFSSGADRPEFCMRLQPGTNYTIVVTARTANYSVIVVANTSIQAPPAPFVTFRDVEGPSPTLRLRRATHTMDAISVYQVFVLLLETRLVFDCSSSRAPPFHGCAAPCLTYVAAQIPLAGAERQLQFTVGDQRRYGEFYNAPLKNGKDYYVILRAVSQWRGVRKQSCVMWAKVRGTSYIIQSVTLMVGGSVGLVAFIVFMGHSYIWYMKKR